MDSVTCGYYLALIECNKIPIPVFSKLLREFGSADALIQLPRAKLERIGLDAPQIDLLQGIRDSAYTRNTTSALEWASKNGNCLVCYESSSYPPLLREIESAPPLLFVRGCLSALVKRQFAVVGSRSATSSGKKNAYWIARELSDAGLLICSGLARGIDSKAHEGALDGGGKTVAVIGTGIDRVYPAGNARLAERIVEHGAIVSEFPIGTPPYSGNFPRRNRIISGLAEGTLVVEANKRSGSLITARLALEQNRDVFAIPGSIAIPQSKGCHHLIKQGAKLVEGPQDILEELDLAGENLVGVDEKTAERETLAAQHSPTTLNVLRAIDHEGCLFHAIQKESNLSFQELNAQLIFLEAAGAIRQAGGRYFRL